MEHEMLSAAVDALYIVSEPTRLMFMALGVFFGLILGIIPGLGGVVGMTMLLPFTYHMDPYAAVAMMLGLGAVTTTSDTIPAVLFGVPGTTGSAATVLDGHPLARQGQAGRALGAAFTASLLGGVLGALLLALSVPVLRPALLSIASPELLAFCVFGISLAASLSGGAVFKGLAAGALGLMITTIGADFLTGTMRWTYGSIYLWNGIPLVPIALGIFAIPELVDMAISRRQLAVGAQVQSSAAGQWEGVKDVLRNKFLVVRCAGIGAMLGSVPGVGTSVIDWIAYGHAARTERGASETFGKGDIRGVIASESSNNAKEGGALVPTIAFGVPGSASMAILLGMFLLHGIVPGPEMLTRQLDMTYTMVWTVALANILGAGICFLFADQLAKIVSIRPGILVPAVMAVIFLGALQGSMNWGDLYVLLVAGVLGWIMKQNGWPRPPLILGVVLGALVEKYLFISVQAYGAEFLLRPVVLVVMAITLVGLLAPLRVKRHARQGLRYGFVGLQALRLDTLLAALFAALFAFTLITSLHWPFSARIVPQIVSGFGLLFALVQLSLLLFTRPILELAPDGSPIPRRSVMDIQSDFDGLTRQTVLQRGAVEFGWLGAFLAAALVIGVLPAAALFMVLRLRISARESWVMVLAITVGVSGTAYFLFHYLLVTPWPGALIGDWSPELRNMFRLF